MASKCMVPMGNEPSINCIAEMERSFGESRSCASKGQFHKRYVSSYKVFIIHGEISRDYHSRISRVFMKYVFSACGPPCPSKLDDIRQAIKRDVSIWLNLLHTLKN